MNASETHRIAVFASGGGTNLGAILAAIDNKTLSATIGRVIVDRPNIGALERAEAAGIRSVVLRPADFDNQTAFGERLLEELRGIHVVALAGYLKRIPDNVVSTFRNKILNIHPALLPSFGGPGMYGKRVHEAVLARGCKVSGATVHLVNEEYDAGPIILQRCVPVKDDDTPESLAKRVLAVEHEIYPKALDLFCRGQLKVKNNRVTILASSSTPT